MNDDVSKTRTGDRAAKPDQPAKQRDLWDRLSILRTLFSTVLLGALTFFVNRQSDQVKTSLASFQNSVSKAQLVHNLIEDLRTNDTRQDLALIGLNRSIGDVSDPDGTNRLMVVQIAKTIFRDRLATKAGGYDSATLVAFSVLAERCGPTSPTALPAVCGKDYTDAVEKLHERAMSVQPAVISKRNATPVPAAAAALPKATLAPSNAATQYLASAFSGVVYIQYGRSTDRTVVEELRKTLDNGSNGTLTAPGIDFVIGNYVDSVRFFHEGDRAAADKLVALVGGFFDRKGAHRSFKVLDFGPRNDVPVGQLEVWIAGAEPAEPAASAAP